MFRTTEILDSPLMPIIAIQREWNEKVHDSKPVYFP